MGDLDIIWNAWCKALEPMTPEPIPEKLKPLFLAMHNSVRNATLEETALMLESNAKRNSDFVSDNAFKMHRMIAPSDTLRNRLEDCVWEDRKYRKAALQVRSLIKK